MKSAIQKRTWQAIYRLSNRVSPLRQDCGLLCRSACCTCGGEDAEARGFSLGIYLLPGEEKLFTQQEDWLEWSECRADDYDFPESWHGRVYFIRCKTPPHCRRDLRPLQCRFFPLAPHLTPDGALHLIRYPQDALPYCCPLISDRAPLSPVFIQVTYTIWKRLIQDPLIRDLIEMESADRQESELDFVRCTR